MAYNEMTSYSNIEIMSKHNKLITIIIYLMIVMV